jgi:hypothetical protein
MLKEFVAQHDGEYSQEYIDQQKEEYEKYLDALAKDGGKDYEVE